MYDFIVIGGTARQDQARRKEWQHFHKAVVLGVRKGSDDISVLHEYCSPRDVCPEFPSVIFKAGTLKDNFLYLCTQTEILVYRVSDFELCHYYSLPCFNDLHHVAPTDRDTILAVVTGLDLVVEIDRDGRIVEEWSAVPAGTWDRFSRATDYRKVPTTQPHQAHPNYVFMLGEEIWVTRCDCNDAICLTDRRKRIDLSGTEDFPSVMVHDGLLHNGQLYFTSVNGTVLIADPERHAVTRVIDLNEIIGTDYPLGWCRGIKVLDEDRIVVGFSKLRQTKLQDKVRWAKAQVKRISGIGNYTQSLPAMPTRICCLNLRTETTEWELPLSGDGIDAVFSIL